MDFEDVSPARYLQYLLVAAIKQGSISLRSILDLDQQETDKSQTGFPSLSTVIHALCFASTSFADRILFVQKIELMSFSIFISNLFLSISLQCTVWGAELSNLFCYLKCRVNTILFA